MPRPDGSQGWAPAESTPRPIAPRRGRKYLIGRMARVLVVDDERDIRQAMAEVLADEGYQVEDAEDGASALAKLRAFHPSVVLLDLMMPGMNGWEFREAQKTDPELSKIPVIVVSALTPNGGVEAEEYLQKPFDLEDLLSAVRRHAAA